MSLNALVAGNKLPVLFIGSGFSRRYLGAPDWDTLLLMVYQFIGKTEPQYKALKLKLKSRIENRGISDGQLNAILAEEIESEFNDYFYSSNLVEEYPEWIEEELNPFRACIASLVSNLDIENSKKEEIEAFKQLKNKVASVITTNYDTLIEKLLELPKESVFIGQPQLFNPNSVELGEIFKIHGCVSNSEEIIITQNDYENFRQNGKLFSAKLLMLITENPVVFIGYSINDPNIQQTLSDLVSCLNPSQIQLLKNHFYLIEHDEGNEELVEKEYLFHATSYSGERTTFPISVISTDNYKRFYEEMSQLTPSMNISTVKQIKRIVKDIVVESVEAKDRADVTTILMDDISKLSNDDQKFAIAVGNIKDINAMYGYNLKPIEDILEDVLFDNKNINSRRIIEETYDKSYFKIQRILPIYKYVTNVSGNVIDECPNVKRFLDNHRKKNDYLNAGIIRSLRTIPATEKFEDLPEDIKNNNRRLYLWYIKTIDKDNLSHVEEYLKSRYENYSKMNSPQQSDFRRLVSLYDFFKYS